MNCFVIEFNYPFGNNSFLNSCVPQKAGDDMTNCWFKTKAYCASTELPVLFISHT